MAADFSEQFDKIQEDFLQAGIPVETPGFYDHPKFLARERSNYLYLNNYARFVATRPYDSDYLERARTTIRRITRALHEGLLQEGRLGACVDASNALSRILDKEGIWNFFVKGALVIDFPPESGLTRKFFWAEDVGEFTAGHAWVFSPPFKVVDLSLSQQPYQGTEASWLPDVVLAEVASKVDVKPSDIVSPDIIDYLRRQGVRGDHILRHINPVLPKFLTTFPAYRLTVDGVKLKYVAVAVGASNEDVDQISNITFAGLSVAEFYRSKIKPSS